MNTEMIADVRAARQVSDIVNLLARLPDSGPAARSLRFYLERWIEEKRPDEAFRPGQFLAEDLSAVMYGRCPVIFEGTNKWNEKPYLEKEQLSLPVERLLRKLKETLRQWKDSRICLLIVPEKDTVIDKLFRRSGRFAEVDRAISILERFARSADIGFCYDSPLNGMEAYLNESDFIYPDSHLPTRLYVQIFSRVLAQFGLQWENVRQELLFNDFNAYGDLAKKFDPALPNPSKKRVPAFRNSDVEQVNGTPEFGTPLGTTWQRLINKSPVWPESIAILGDSHSSIISRHMLTYLSAGTFAKCEFYWNPLSLRNPEQKIKADFVLLEISQRFIF